MQFRKISDSRLSRFLLIKKGIGHYKAFIIRLHTDFHRVK
jgi:hypothetical protein